MLQKIATLNKFWSLEICISILINFASTTVFNIDNKKKCCQYANVHIRMIY